MRGTANWTCFTPDQLRAVCGLVVGLAAGCGRPLVVRVDRVVSAHWLESSCPECWRRTRNQRPAQSRVVDPGALGCGEGKGHPEQCGREWLHELKQPLHSDQFFYGDYGGEFM